MKLLIFCILMFSGCLYNAEVVNRRVVIRNDSGIDFDSAKISVNNYSGTIEDIKRSSDSFLEFSRNAVSANHDVLLHIELYRSDSIISKETIFLNDLGFIPELTTVKVNNELRMFRE